MTILPSCVNDKNALENETDITIETLLDNLKGNLLLLPNWQEVRTVSKDLAEESFIDSTDWSLCKIAAPGWSSLLCQSVDGAIMEAWKQWVDEVGDEMIG